MTDLMTDACVQAPQSPISPGFIVLHGNRSEDLMQTLVAWLGRYPLQPLEEEVFLVQSSGMSEWIKMELARQSGVCSAMRAELPGQFLWRLYRQVLGARGVPRDSPLDKLPLTWRLMGVLPERVQEPVFAPIARYLWTDLQNTGQPEPSRLLQLTSQLADLFDQYQNHRNDWLQLWAGGRDEITDPHGQAQALAADQRWQPALWRAVLQNLTEAQRSATRPELHRLALQRRRSLAPIG